MRNLLAAPVVLAVLAVVAVLFASCGGGHRQNPKYPLDTASGLPHCAQVHELGGCIAERYGVKRTGQHRARLGPVGFGERCADYSQWQGYRPSLVGVSCAIFQSNYGTSVEPSIYSQMRDAREHGVPFGCYTFMEPGVGGEAEANVANDACSASAGRRAGLWSDSEVSGVYEHTCPYVRRAAQLSDIAGQYGSPGTDEAGYCGGYDWPAEWGGGAYPLRGYPWSATVLRQDCGTCWFNGQEQDLDEDRGLIALSHPTPPETPSQRRARERRVLANDERQLVALRGRIHALAYVEDRHGCRLDRRHHMHLRPHTHRQWQTCVRWDGEGNAGHARGKQLDRQVARLRRELA